MSYQKAQNLKCRCPLIRLGVYGIQESHQVPNIPCDRSLNDVLLHQHLQWYHNFDSVSARKLARAISNNMNPNEHLFSIHEPLIKRNISVESYKCKCPLTHDGVFGLTEEYEITNVPCGRAEKEVLCFQHLQYHHNLSSRAAKKIVLAVLSYTPTITQLFHSDDLVTQSKCAVRKLKSKCPLSSRHLYGIGDQHQVPNIPCDRADQHVFLFHHLTYFHKLNPKSATKLIRALILNKDPSEILFHYNDIIVISSNQTFNNQHLKPTKTKSDNQQRYEQLNYSANLVGDIRSKYQCFFNPINMSALMNSNPTTKSDNNNTIPFDYSLMKQQSYQMSYPYSGNEMTHLYGFDLNSYLT